MENASTESGVFYMAADDDTEMVSVNESSDFDVSFQSQLHESKILSNSKNIHTENLTIRAKGHVLLDNALLKLSYGRKYGLVGPNGKGKTTLLRMIARRKIPIPSNLDILMVEQEVNGSNVTALDAVVSSNAKVVTLKNQARLLESSDVEDPENLIKIYKKLQNQEDLSAGSRASKILNGLGFTDVMQKTPTRSFSGGWRMRISIAQALFMSPSILLLDEPTNHLDLRAVLWLQETLRVWKGTLVVVSHDREFLNNVTTDIIHLHDRALRYYQGNYDQFEDMFLKKKTEANKIHDREVKKKKRVKKTNKPMKLERGVGQRGKLGKRDGIPPKWLDYTVKFHFPCPSLSSEWLIQVKDVDFSYSGNSKYILSKLNLGVNTSSRIAIVGPNGEGKTTLLKLLVGELKPTRGEVTRNHKIRIGCYSQHFIDILNMRNDPVTFLLEKFPQKNMKPEEMRALLGKFGLPGQSHLRPIQNLSGGQKARVVLANISLSEPHLLVLDEPTNHLDMESIDALADALEKYTGGVIIVSHDARLLDRVCEDDERSEVWVVSGGSVCLYDGSFLDYRDELAETVMHD